jgi:hypothetical protein
VKVACSTRTWQTFGTFGMCLGNDAALAYISEELGCSAAPVVVIDDPEHWSGFRPNLIGAIAPGGTSADAGHQGAVDDHR